MQKMIALWYSVQQKFKFLPVTLANLTNDESPTFSITPNVPERNFADNLPLKFFS